MYLFTHDCTLENIIEEQYQLARKGGIGFLESNNMADFEREACLNMLLRDLKNEAKQFTFNEV